MSEHDEMTTIIPAPLSPVEMRARALEELLIEKGLVAARTSSTRSSAPTSTTSGR